MLDAIGDVFDVRFEERTFGADVGLDAWVLHEEDAKSMRRFANCQLPCYVVIRADQLVPCGLSPIIEFSRCHALPPLLMGRQIKAAEAAELMSLPRHLGDMTILASKSDAPVWATQDSEGLRHHYVATPVPELNDGEPLFQYFHGRQFLKLLPLVLFVRALTDDKGWEQPPLHACFMLDDPNLHWRTYGFVNFSDIAAHAELHNYHVSFATIPLDTWFVHKPTAALFKEHRDQLSLLIHGNDHIAQELARPYVDDELSANLRQALRRIEEFERRSGVEVSKVMAPPHGACSERALAAMAHLGFEAASISRGSLRHYNGGANWVRILGMKPSDIIAGLPVFYRFPLSESCHNSVLIAALLHQPIIAVGHHQDVAEGLQLLADLSGFVNSLGTVYWTDMKRIARSHYAQRFDGGILRVRMFTGHIQMNLPDGASQLWVERPWVQVAESLPLAWRIAGDASEWRLCDPNEPIPVLPRQRIEICSGPPRLPFVDTKNLRNFHLWPVARRQLTEARDRLTPVLRRCSAFLTKSNGT